MSPDAFYEIDRGLSHGLITGEFASYQRHLHMPLVIERIGAATLHLDNPDELRADFQLYHDVMKLHGVTDVFREITDARRHDNGDFTIACTTHIMSRARRVLDPFATEFDLKEVNEKWLVRTIRGTIRHTNWAPGKADLTTVRQPRLDS